MGLLDRLDSVAGGGCERAYGEAAELRPQRLGRVSESADDPSRPAITVRGVFALEADAKSIFADRREGMSARSGTPTIQYDAAFELSAETVAALPFEIKRGDLIVMTRRGSARYRVGHIFPADLGSQSLFLSRAEEVL